MTISAVYIKQESLGLADPALVWRFENHIRRLAEHHGITVRWATNGYAAAKLSEKTILTAPIRGEASYAIALHEVGHVVDPEALQHHDRERQAQHPRRKAEYLIRGELAAWGWAHARAITWTPIMEATKRAALWSHYATAHLDGTLTQWAQAELLHAIGLTQAEADRRFAAAVAEAGQLAGRHARPSTKGGSAMRKVGELEVAVTALPTANGPVRVDRPESVRAIVKRLAAWKTQPETCEACHDADAKSLIGNRALCRGCAATVRGARSASTPAGQSLATLERRLRLAVSR